MYKRDISDLENDENKKRIKTLEDINEEQIDDENVDQAIEDEEDQVESNIESLSQFFGIKERINKNFKRFFGLIKQMYFNFSFNF